MDIETFKKYSETPECYNGNGKPLWFFTFYFEDIEPVYEDSVGWQEDFFNDIRFNTFHADRFLKVCCSTSYEINDHSEEDIVELHYEGHSFLIPIQWVFETEVEAINGLNQTALQFFYKAFQTYKNIILKSSIDGVVGEFNRSVSILGDIGWKENVQCKDCWFTKVESFKPFEAFCKKGYWGSENSYVEFYKHRKCICFLEKEVSK